MTPWRINFSRTHRTIFLVMWAVFAALTFTVTAMNVPHGPDGYGQVVWATIGTLAGPMPGALSRGCQSCPDGNGVELYWDRPKEQWPSDANGGLAMFTHPLDLDALLNDSA